MGLYEYTLKCGCIEVTSTLENPKNSQTFVVKACKAHQEKKKEDGKSSQSQKDPTK